MSTLTLAGATDGSIIKPGKEFTVTFSGKDSDLKYYAASIKVGYDLNRDGKIVVISSKYGKVSSKGSTLTLTATFTAPNVTTDTVLRVYCKKSTKSSSSNIIEFEADDPNTSSTLLGTFTIQPDNYVPTISGLDSDLGEKTECFTQSFIVDDKNTVDTLTVTTYIDSTQISKFTASRNVNYNVSLDSYWSNIVAGKHTIKITCSDGKATTTRIYTFTKKIINTPPTISGYDENFGERSSAFNIVYSINDVDASNILTITEKVNSTVIRTFTANRNVNNTVDLTNIWSSLPLSNVLTISVSDGIDTTIRTYRFIKNIGSNNIPSISGQNGDLGEQKRAFSLKYTVNDSDQNDTLDVTIKIDNTVMGLYPNVQKGVAQTYSIDSESFSKLSNGSHVLCITASDGKTYANRFYTFTKNASTTSATDNLINTLNSKKIDFKNSKEIYLKCKQMDDVFLVFEIFNDGAAIDIEDYFIEIRAMNGDSLLLITDEGITKNKNIVTIECLRELTSRSGETKIELRFSNAKGKQKRTFNIILDVESCIPDNSENVLAISALDKLDILVDKAIQMNEDLERNLSNFEEMTDIIDGYENRCTNMIKDLEVTIDGLSDTLNDIKSDIKKAEELIDTLNNTEYLQHVHNEDVHVTQEEKIKWNKYESKINQIIGFIDDFVLTGSYVVDEDGNKIIDEDGKFIIL